jgi:hypothetical protein
MENPLAIRGHASKQIDEYFAVRILADDVLPIIAAAGDVVEGSRDVAAKRAAHLWGGRELHQSVRENLTSEGAQVAQLAET